MDDTDKAILEKLQENARKPLSEIGEELNLSIPAVSKRVRKLENSNVIRRYTAILEPEQFGKKLICFCLVTLKRSNPENIKRFYNLVGSHPDILECHCIAGEYEYLLKIVTESAKHLEELLVKLRQEFPMLSSNSYIVLSTSKEVPSISPL